MIYKITLDAFHVTGFCVEGAIIVTFKCFDSSSIRPKCRVYSSDGIYHKVELSSAKLVCFWSVEDLSIFLDKIIFAKEVRKDVQFTSNRFEELGIAQQNSAKFSVVRGKATCDIMPEEARFEEYQVK